MSMSKPDTTTYTIYEKAGGAEGRSAERGLEARRRAYEGSVFELVVLVAENTSSVALGPWAWAYCLPIAELLVAASSFNVTLVLKSS